MKVLNKEDERLLGWVDKREFPTTVKALLFGELVRRSVTRHFQSDLFHDAMFINELTGESEFIWITREWGTHIGEEDSAGIRYLISEAFSSRESAMVFRIKLYFETGHGNDGTWRALFTELGEEK